MASSSADDQHKRQQEGDDLDEVLVAAGAQGGSATSQDQGEDRRKVDATRAQRTKALTVTSANHAAIGVLAQPGSQAVPRRDNECATCVTHALIEMTAAVLHELMQSAEVLVDSSAHVVPPAAGGQRSEEAAGGLQRPGRPRR